MITQTAKVKNGAILLPSNARRGWKEADVFVRVSDETIVIKKIKKAPFWETWEKMRRVGKNISRKDIEDAIIWARRKSQR